MAKASKKEDKDLAVLSHYRLRRALGLLGLLLPGVLVAAAAFGFEPIGRSISIYYYTEHLGQFLTGALWSIGVFLLFYEGHTTIPSAFRKLPDWLARRMTDANLTTFAGLFALVTAAVPTCETTETCALFLPSLLAGVHLGAAALFLGILGVMAIWVFTESDKPRGQWEQDKIWSNRVYITAGLTIFASLIGGAASLLLRGEGSDSTALFWFECLAVAAFAVAWLVKGKVAQNVARILRGAAS